MSTRVYVGGLNYRCREEDIERFFRKCGRIKEISIKKGYAFVEFEDYRDADDACYELHGKELMGERITIELAKGTPHGRDKERWGGGYGGGSRRRSRSRDRGAGGGGRDRDGRRPVWLEKYGPPTRTDYRVIVENLSSTVSWQDLKDFMRQAGDVTYADAHKSRRNEGVVEFSNHEDMKHALSKLDDMELNGRRIKLVDDSRGGAGGKRSATRSRSKTRSRSRSRRDRSRSRSGSRKARSRSGSAKDKKSASRSRSRSPRGKSRSPRDKSRSKSRSRSRSPREKSRSRSKDKSRSPKAKARSVSRARSASRSRSRSRSPKEEKRSRSRESKEN